MLAHLVAKQSCIERANPLDQAEVTRIVQWAASGASYALRDQALDMDRASYSTYKFYCSDCWRYLPPYSFTRPVRYRIRFQALRDFRRDGSTLARETC